MEAVKNGVAATPPNGKSPLKNTSADVALEEQIKQKAAAAEAPQPPPYPMRRLLVMMGGVFFVGFHQGLFFPTIGHTVTVDLGYGAKWVGAAFFLFMTTGLLGIMSLPKLLRWMTPRTLFMWIMWVRCLSAGFYIVVPMATSMLGEWAGLTSFMIARLLHGTAPVSQIGGISVISIRVAGPERGKWITLITLILTMGFLIGPQVGSVLAAYSPNTAAASANAGWVQLITSLMLLLWYMIAFDDYDLLVKEPPPKVTDPAQARLMKLCANRLLERMTVLSRLSLASGGGFAPDRVRSAGHSRRHVRGHVCLRRRRRARVRPRPHRLR